MQRQRASHPQAVLDRLLAHTEGQAGFLQHALLKLSADQQRVLAEAIERMLHAPWTVVRDERVDLGPGGWPPGEHDDPQLAVLTAVLRELDARALLPDAVRRVQVRLILNPACAPEGSTRVRLSEVVGGGAGVAWSWDLELGYGGSATWADTWLPGPPVGGLWATGTRDGHAWGPLGRVDAAQPALRVERLRAAELDLGWLEGGWGQGVLTGVGLVYGERWSPDLERAVDEILVALAPVAGKLVAVPGA